MGLLIPVTAAAQGRQEPTTLATGPSERCRVRTDIDRVIRSKIHVTIRVARTACAWLLWRLLLLTLLLIGRRQLSWRVVLPHEETLLGCLTANATE